MLILTRHRSETICIGEQITVTVLGVVGNRVRLGVRAPREITVDREEIYLKKRQDQEAAAARSDGPVAKEANGGRRRTRS